MMSGQAAPASQPAIHTCEVVVDVIRDEPNYRCTTFPRCGAVAAQAVRFTGAADGTAATLAGGTAVVRYLCSDHRMSPHAIVAVDLGGTYTTVGTDLAAIPVPAADLPDLEARK